MSTRNSASLSPLTGSSLAPLLKSAQRRRRTGLFTVRTPGALRTISVLRGEVVFAGSNDREERLNSVLLRCGLISLRDLAGAVEAMLRESRRLGEILLERRLLSEEGLRSALKRQIEEIVCGVLARRDSEVEYLDRPMPPHDDISFERPVNALIYRAAFMMRDFHYVMDEIGGPAAVLTTTDGFVEEAEACRLDPTHQGLLSRLDEPRSLVQLCDELDLPDFDVCRLVWALLSAGALSRLE